MGMHCRRHEIGVARSHSPVHEPEHHVRLSFGDPVEVPAELTGRVLLELAARPR